MSEAPWAALGDDDLLTIRMCDLGLSIEGTELEPRIALLGAELDARGLKFRPHFWLSDEWFTPDGVPGVAIPFYLAHPRLARLELSQMLEVEGGDPDEPGADLGRQRLVGPAGRSGQHREVLLDGGAAVAEEPQVERLVGRGGV